MMGGHALYVGTVGHQRLRPKRHALNYPIQYFWLELTAAASIPTALLKNNFGAFRLRRRDYLQNCPALAELPLSQAVFIRASQLGAILHGDEQLFLLSPLANWGRYFSPLTQYYIYRAGEPCYLLAEVSNTPWNERHHYLVPLTGSDSRHQQDKQFHVSPFNTLQMQYHWKVKLSAQQLQLSIENFQKPNPQYERQDLLTPHNLAPQNLAQHKSTQQQAATAVPDRAAEKVFSAWYQLNRQPLNQQTLRQALIRQPWQNVQVLVRIYWHALLLLLKGVPFVPYQKSKDAQR